MVEAPYVPSAVVFSASLRAQYVVEPPRPDTVIDDPLDRDCTEPGHGHHRGAACIREPETRNSPDRPSVSPAREPAGHAQYER
ncbi:hypothetical protein GTS_47590 [Gandjariella thermophila]|uniref:Uncharacterized protein n=1 Tax=Gandjariella thermophila TaxID=1931992 RepID=A0A4D4JFF0_9PSEU|nr:hypothetical protein GTS_47590 [Gandjariella thermophila]